MDGQIEVVNRSVGTLLRVLIKKNLKAWDLLLAHAKFAYNRSTNRTTIESPLKVFYGQNPHGPRDLTPLPRNESMSTKAIQRVKEIQEWVKSQIEKANECYQSQANKRRKKALFRPADLVWAHLRKQRFPSKRKSKLIPRANGPFEVLEKINDNAYKIDLPGDYGVSCTFNISDFEPYFEDDNIKNLRANSFLEGEDNVPMGDQLYEPKEGANSQDFKHTSRFVQEVLPRLLSGLNPKKAQLCWLIS